MKYKKREGTPVSSLAAGTEVPSSVSIVGQNKDKGVSGKAQPCFRHISGIHKRVNSHAGKMGV